MPEPKEIFQPDAFYHVFNKSVGDELLFKNPENYSHFLSLTKKYLDQFVSFYAYCLIPNHFHFLIQVKNENCLYSEEGFMKERSKDIISNFISRKFGNVFNAYAQSYNSANNRKGSLFKNRFQRKRINEQKYLIELIQYIHLNPIEAGLCENIEDWIYSSYNAILSDRDSMIKKEEVLVWFGDIENFVFVHK